MEKVGKQFFFLRQYLFLDMLSQRARARKKLRFVAYLRINLCTARVRKNPEFRSLSAKLSEPLD